MDRVQRLTAHFCGANASKDVYIGGLNVKTELFALVRDEILPGTGISPHHFWKSLGNVVRILGPKNKVKFMILNGTKDDLPFSCF